MVKILIGICSTREDKAFLESFNNFWNKALEKYNITVTWQYNRFLPDAQNAITDLFLGGDYKYLLLLDDDHSGHTVEMLDCLIGADTYVATMKTYCRHYPYVVALWDRLDANNTIPIENGKGYRTIDLTGFPMTLIRRDLFNKLDKPYFRPFSDGGRDWNSDVDFFRRLDLIGIKPVGCFQYCLNHDKITQENVFKYREDERLHNNNIAWYAVLQEQINKQQLTKTKEEIPVS